MLNNMAGVLKPAAPMPGAGSIAPITIMNAGAVSSALPVSGPLPGIQAAMPGRYGEWLITVQGCRRNNVPDISVSNYAGI